MKTLVEKYTPKDEVAVSEVDFSQRPLIICTRGNDVYTPVYLTGNKYAWNYLFTNSFGTIKNSMGLNEDIKLWIKNSWNVYWFESAKEMREWLTKFLAENK